MAPAWQVSHGSSMASNFHAVANAKSNSHDRIEDKDGKVVMREKI